MSINDKQRIVIKVGSALIAPEGKGCSTKYLSNIADFISSCRQRGQQVILVSSGSVAAGKQWFDNPTVTKGVKKAMASVGQTEMMAIWGKLLGDPLAQILLTHADLCNRERYVSIKETIESLLANGMIPVINENDTVTSEEVKVGDNDNLAAMAASAVDADVLIMCTDVNGLYDRNPTTNPDAKLFSVVTEISPELYDMAGGVTSAVGTGGMLTKIEAAEKSTAHGIDTYIINGFQQESFSKLLQGLNPGTHFLPHEAPLAPSVHWMTHTVRERGEVIIDDENQDFAESDEFLTTDNILEVKGQFGVGDTVVVSTDDGTRVAKAKVNYSSCLLNYIAQEQSDEDDADYNQPQNRPIISKEHIAVLENE
ncbi:MAG: glutamate 5-kinase [Gammaproteobacteria bacterium]|nr:glutamate 5-kinase [Gammaproteobacteria bacterium]